MELCVHQCGAAHAPDVGFTPLQRRAARTTASPVPVPVPVPPLAPTLTAPPHADSSSAATNPDALAAEIRLIDEARADLRQSDPGAALETLTRYDQLVKHGGSMRAEATVVRVEALQASGDTARATALGQRFLAKNPQSPYADYVKRILARTH